MLCEYGCGQEAIHKFKYGKWCCSKSCNKCPSQRQKNANSQLGKIISDEAKLKLSKSMLGKTPWNKGKTGIYSIESLKKMSDSTKGRPPGNKFTISKIKEKYPLFSSIEEIRVDPNNSNEIQVHCKNHRCENSKEKGGWFTLKNRQFLIDRIRSLEAGFDGCYFYCSDECKYSCPLFGKTINQLIKQDRINAGIIPEPVYSAGEYQIYRQEVLQRANNKCEYCNSIATDVHHSRPQKLEPGFSLDPDFGIACCEECHYKYGHKDECSTGKLANVVCV